MYLVPIRLCLMENCGCPQNWAKILKQNLKCQVLERQAQCNTNGSNLEDIFGRYLEPLYDFEWLIF